MNLPFNRNAEIGVLGACLEPGVGNAQMETILLAGEMIPAKCFYHDDTRFLFECIQNAAKGGQMSDMFSLMTQWKAFYPALKFPDEVLAAPDLHGKHQLQDRAATVLDLYKRRQAMTAAYGLMTGAEKLSKPLHGTVAEFEEALGQSHTNSVPMLDGAALGRNVREDLERRYNLNGEMSGIDCGLAGLNKITDGLQLGEFWIVGARPGTGKTALALNIAAHVSITLGIPSLFVSLEMSATALGRRLASSCGEINGGEIRRGTFTAGGFKALGKFSTDLSKAPLHILDSPGGIGITQLCHSVRAAIKRHGIKVVFIDYLQKIRGEGKAEKKTYEIGENSSALVELTKRENVNMFALAQLNRESEKDKGRRPRSSDLADSKSIEADADFIGLLDRPIEGDETRAQLIVTKQRDGERAIIPLEYRGWHCKFLMDTREWNTK